MSQSTLEEASLRVMDVSNRGADMLKDISRIAVLASMSSGSDERLGHLEEVADRVGESLTEISPTISEAKSVLSDALRVEGEPVVVDDALRLSVKSRLLDVKLFVDQIHRVGGGLDRAVGGMLGTDFSDAQLAYLDAGLDEVSGVLKNVSMDMTRVCGYLGEVLFGELKEDGGDV